MGKIVIFLIITLILFSVAAPTVGFFGWLIPITVFLLVLSILVWVGSKLFK